MKYLTVIRHAKPENQQAGEDDAARRLTKDGVAAAFRLGQLLAKKECIPDLVITSPARRARETADQVCRALDLGDDIVKVDPELYLNDVAGILNMLQALPEEKHHVFIIGHNPSLAHLVDSFCGPVVKNMSAGGAACIKLAETGIGEGALMFYIEP